MTKLIDNQSRLQDLIEQDNELFNTLENSDNIEEKYKTLLLRVKINKEIIQLRTEIAIQESCLRNIK